MAVVGYTASPVSGDITKSYGGKDALRIIIDTDTGEGLVDVFGEYADETAYGIVQDSDDRMIIVGDTHSSFSAYGETNSGGIDMFSLIRTFAPVITLPDETVIRYQGEDLDLLAGVTASDYEDGDISSNIQVTGAPIDTSTVGEYTITYTVTDSDNNATSVEAALFIYIPQPPVLTVPGTTIIQPGESFDPRIDTTAMDPDGDAGGPLDISTDITFTGAPVDTNISGTYLITYRVEDAQGNVVTQKRTLIIEEKPEIIFEDGIVIELNDTAFNAFDGVVGMDAEDGSVEVTVIYNDVDVTTAGQYEIVYSATDSKNNTTIKKRTVFVSSAPIITHPGKTIVYLGESFDPRLGVTAIDAEDGDLTEQVLIGGDIVDTNSAGDYVVTYSVSDIAGSEAFETRINVVTSRPIITGTDDLAINPGSVFDPLSGVEATDAEDGDITDRIEILSNNLNVDIPGTYTIIYYVEDKNGGNYTASRIITVTEKPVIVGADDKTVNPDGSFDPMNGITATDNEDDNSTLNVTITGGSGVGQD